jgi:hypothetical protein
VKGLGKTAQYRRITGVAAGIRTEHLPNTIRIVTTTPAVTSVFRVGKVISALKIEAAGWGGTDWIHLPQDRDQWRGLVNFWGSIEYREVFE